MHVPLLGALEDPRLLGSLQWWPSQTRLLRTLEGREVTHAWNVARQSGKTSMVAAVAVHNCSCRDDLDRLVDFRRRHVLVVSSNQEQSENFLEIAGEFASRSPVLSRYVKVKQDHIEFRLPSGAKPVIVAMPARDAATRGRTASMIVLDEAGHLSDTAGASSDERLFSALTPSTVRFGDLARIILISTPRGTDNLFHRICTEAAAGVLPSARSETRTIVDMQPWISRDWLEARRAELGESLYQQEYFCDWVSGPSSFIDLSRIVFVGGPAAPSEGRNWTAACDLGYHRDLTGVCVIGESVDSPGLLVMGATGGIRGDRALSYFGRRRNEDAVLGEVWKRVEPYSPRRLVVDQYQAAPVKHSFEELHGLPVQVLNITGELKRKMFTSLRARLEGGSLQAWSEPQLQADLRRIRVTGADGIDLVRAGDSHCDVAMACAMAAWQFRAATGAPSPRFRPPMLGSFDDFPHPERPNSQPSRRGRRWRDPDAKGRSPNPPPGWGGRGSRWDRLW